MDYIREELLRQRKILSVLMGGGQQKELEPLESKEDEILQNGQTAAGLREQTRAVQDMATETIQHPHRRSGPVEESAATVRADIFLGNREEKPRVRAFSAVEERGVPVQMARYERLAPEEPADAREISRSIQRDARRYDGGFSIY